MDGGTPSEYESMDANTDYGDNGSPDCDMEAETEPSHEQLGSETGGFESTPLQIMQLEIGNVAEPCVGMEFATEEDVWTFYNVYAHQVGFNTRISVMHRSRRSGSIMSRQFVCAKEGFRIYKGKMESGVESCRGRRARAVTRVGCKAMIRVKKLENERWVVTKVEKAHNHGLIPPTQMHCLRTHKPLAECGKPRSVSHHRHDNLLLTCAETTTETNKVYTRIGYSAIGGHVNQITLDYIRRMNLEDPDFFYAFQFVEGHSQGNIFWADSKSRAAYASFGDTVILDDFSKRNHFKIPIVAVTGFNHHCQPMLFACALIVDDSESSFTWLLESFVSAMSGHHPVSITTEFSNDLKAAVLRVLPQTRHRFCKWHILESAWDMLPHVCNAYPSFRDELVNVVNASESVDEFEESWKAVVSKYTLKDNETLQSIYGCRHQWVPAFFKNVFFTDSFIQRQCASNSSLFEGYIDAQTDEDKFVQQYEKALDGCYEKEVKEEFDTKYSLPDIKTVWSIEKQAAKLYTRAIFSRFQEELIGASALKIEVREEGNPCVYKVTKFKGKHKGRIVKLNTSSNNAVCTCQMFEHCGIVCRHILSVFIERGISVLPNNFVMKRWTRNATENDGEKANSMPANEAKSENDGLSHASQQSRVWRYNNLYHTALQLVEDGAASAEMYSLAMHALQEAVKKVENAKLNIGEHEKVNGTSNGIAAATEGLISQHLKPSNQLSCLQPNGFPPESTGASSEQKSSPYSRLIKNSDQALQGYSEHEIKDHPGKPKAGVAISASLLHSPLNFPGPCSRLPKGQSHAPNGNLVNFISRAGSTSAPQLVTVPVQLCSPPVDGLSIVQAEENMSNCTNDGGCTSTHHPSPESLTQPQSNLNTRTDDNASPSAAMSINSIRAAAIAAGARVVSPSVQARNAILVQPAEGPSSCSRPIAPQPQHAEATFDLHNGTGILECVQKRVPEMSPASSYCSEDEETDTDTDRDGCQAAPC